PVDLRASREVPSLHRLVRPSLVPSLRIAEPLPPPPARPAPLPKPKNLAELEEATAEVARRAEQRKKERAEREAAEAAAKLAAAPPGEGPPGFVPVLDPAISEREFIHARTRECFEEVAMIGSQRAPLLGDPWRTSTVLERRMLASIDAL